MLILFTIESSSSIYLHMIKGSTQRNQLLLFIELEFISQMTILTDVNQIIFRPLPPYVLFVLLYRLLFVELASLPVKLLPFNRLIIYSIDITYTFVYGNVCNNLYRL